MKDLEIFAQILQSLYNIYLWIFDKDGNMTFSNCPNLERVDHFFLKAFVDEAIRFNERYRKPSISASKVQTFWIIDSVWDQNSLKDLYLLGPFHLDSYSKEAARKQLEEEFSFSIEKKYQILEDISTLPIISFTKALDYTIMMHYAITKEKVSFGDLYYNSLPDLKADENKEEFEFHGTYELEQEMLRMVSEGDIRVIEMLKKTSDMSTVGKLANEDSEPLRQLKNTLLVATTLFSRAAIKGGVYPDTALTLTDRYFQSIEACQSFHELTDIAFVMEEDFVTRVHTIRSNTEHSRTTSNLIDYIYLHLEDDLSLKQMADEFGYTEYYLSKKFKSETGIPIKEYIRDQRLERSKQMLQQNNIPISEISDRLHFTSQSYFTKVFREKYGITPKQYKNGKS